MAVRAAVLVNTHAAGLLGAPALGTSHQSAALEGRCQKQTGPALFAPGNNRTAGSPPPAAWLTPRVPVTVRASFQAAPGNFFKGSLRPLRAIAPRAIIVFFFYYLFIIIIFYQICSDSSAGA
jgi:hypothetical protein